MSIHFRASLAMIADSGPNSIGNEPIVSTLSSESLGDVSPLTRPLQLEWSPHVAALAGIVALALLGGVLVARNRFDQQNAFVADPEPRREEFLTDREHVQQLIRENGGRMKQSKIVNDVDWSKAKVSRLLAELEEEGRITKLRLGRENLVCLPGHEPTASQSPETPKNE
ncbi:helix-turn-helix transcriptional regulator [Haloterrigena salina]|nr:hypothetical protein [Haloterrigena salina]